LRQVEDILTKYTLRKKELTNDINSIIRREDKISLLMDELDSRIGTIGDHTIKVEKTIRSIKGP
jgi:hypothetical protein